jgi:hypothetical protein
MIDLELLVVFDGEKVLVNEIKPADFVHLERHFNVPLPNLKGQLGFEHMCFLTWRFLRRRLEGIGGFDDDFLERIDDVSPVTTPFVPGDDPSPGPSPS